METLGLILAVVVHPADVPDRDETKRVLGLLKTRFRRRRRLWADGGSAGPLVEWVRGPRVWNKRRLAIVKRPDDAQGFVVLPRRWVVDTTCESKKWAQDALAYNSLVIAWPQISRLAASRPEAADRQSELY